MSSHAPSPPVDRQSGKNAAEEQQIEKQFQGMDNDLVHIEAFDGAPEGGDPATAEDVDETSAGGLQYPPGVETSKGGPAS